MSRFFCAFKMPMTGKSFKWKRKCKIFWCWGWTNERTSGEGDVPYCFRLLCSLSSSVQDWGWLWLQCLVGTNSAKQFLIFSSCFACQHRASWSFDAQARCFGHMLEGTVSSDKVWTEPDRMPKSTPSSAELQVLRLCFTTWVAQLGSYSLAAMALNFDPTKYYAGELEHGDVCERASYAKISDN